jgi:hypothetical protein
MPLTRRHLLAMGALATAASVVGVAAVGVSWWDQPAGAGYKHLSDDEAAIILALAGAAYPATPQIPVSGATLDADRFLDSAMDGLAPLLGDAVRAALHGINALPMSSHGGSFLSLTDAERGAVLISWIDSDLMPLRGVATLLVALMGMAYTSHPEVAPFFAVLHGCGYGR